MAKKLTPGTLRAIKAPARGQREHFDKLVAGLALRTSQGGARTWSLLYRDAGGKRRRITIGKAPEVGLAEARTIARDLRAKVRLGGDPADERKRRHDVPTLRNAFELYLERQGKLHNRSWRQTELIFKRDTPAAWLSRRVDTITRNEVAGRHAEIGKRSRFGANAWARIIRAIYHRLDDWELWQGRNPAKLARGTWFHEEPRRRILGADELPRLWAALAPEPYQWRAFFTLLLFTGLRRGELASAEWKNYDAAAQTLLIEAHRTKSKRERLIALVAPVVELIEGLPSRGCSPFLFPPTGGMKSRTGHLVEPYQRWQRVCARAGLVGLRMHDLRRTNASWSAAAGTSLAILQKSLGHADVATTIKAYAHLDLAPIRAAAEANVARLIAAAMPTLAGPAK